MAFFRYVPPAEIEPPAIETSFGLRFETNGAATEVTDGFAVAKLRGHIHFEEVFPPGDGQEPVLPHDEAGADDTVAGWQSMDKAELDEFAKANGIVLDRRMNLSNMQAAFAEALAAKASEV